MIRYRAFEINVFKNRFGNKFLMSLSQAKRILREKFLKLLRNQEEELRLKKSRLIQKKLFSMRRFTEAKTVLFYASFDGEVETREMMEQAKLLGKKILLPAIIKDQKKIIPATVEDFNCDLHVGSHGIQEPKNPLNRAVAVEDIDLIIVPGVAFDKSNNRLGRGRGYYDRFLTDIPARIPTLGLAFDFQLVDQLSHLEKHDIKVSQVIFNQHN